MGLHEKKVAMKYPYNKRTLIEAIIKVWKDGISPEILTHLFKSMTKRIDECVKGRGFGTKY